MGEGAGDDVTVGVAVPVGDAASVGMEVGGRGVKVGVAVSVGANVAVGVGLGIIEHPLMTSEEKAQNNRSAKRRGDCIWFDLSALKVTATMRLSWIRL